MNFEQSLKRLDEIVKGLEKGDVSLSESMSLFEEGANILVIIACFALGSFLGELIDLDKHVNTLGALIEKKVDKSGKYGKIAEGFFHTRNPSIHASR